jgi:hypothetical protein
MSTEMNAIEKLIEYNSAPFPGNWQLAGEAKAQLTALQAKAVELEEAVNDKQGVADCFRVECDKALERAGQNELKLEQYRAVTREMGVKLRDAQMFIEAQYIDWALVSRESPDYDPNYKPEFPQIVADITAALAKLKALDQ